MDAVSSMAIFSNGAAAADQRADGQWSAMLHCCVRAQYSFDELDGGRVLDVPVRVSPVHQRREVTSVLTHHILCTRDNCSLPDFDVRPIAQLGPVRRSSVA